MGLVVVNMEFTRLGHKGRERTLSMQGERPRSKELNRVNPLKRERRGPGGHQPS